jgi:protocatechuate 3,4-dioxygenase beta subunit
MRYPESIQCKCSARANPLLILVVLFGIAIIAGFLILIMESEGPATDGVSPDYAKGGAGRTPVDSIAEESIESDSQQEGAREQLMPGEGRTRIPGEKGFETLKGLVINESGAAVAGVQVKAVRIGSPDGPMGQGAFRIFKTTSAADGTFGLASMPIGTYSLAAVQGGLAGNARAFVANRRSHPTGVSRSCEIVLKPSGTIDGRVLGPDGAPIQSAVVEPGAMQAAFSMTDGEGRFVLEDLVQGVYAVAANADGFASKTIEDVVTGESGLEILLGLEGRISGKVFFEGRPRPGIRIIARGKGAFNRRTWEAVSGKDGGYVLGSLAEGRYTVGVVSTEFAAPAITRIVVDEGEHLENIDFILERPGGLEGVVKDAESGQLIEGAWVRAVPANKALSRFSITGASRTFLLEFEQTNVQTDRKGVFQFTSLAPASYILVVMGAGEYMPTPWKGGRLVEAVSGDSKIGMEILLSRGQALKVKVRGESGERLRGAMLFLMDAAPWDVSDPLSRMAELLPLAEELGDGDYRFRGLKPGELRLRVSRRGWISATKTVAVVEGEDPADLEVVLSPTFAVTGRVVNPGRKGIAGAGVRFTDDRQAATDEAGNFRISDMGPERNWVQVYAEGFMSLNTRVDLKRGMDSLELTLKPVGTHYLAGVVKNDLGEPMAGVKLNLHQTIDDHRLHKICTSGDQGTFYMDGLQKAKTSLYVTTNQGYPRAQPAELVVDRDDVELIVDRFARVKGRVVNPEGKPVEKFTAAFLSQYRLDARSGSEFHDGVFDMVQTPPGRVKIQVTTPDGREGTSDRLEVKPGEVLEGVTITLQKLCSLSGTVRGGTTLQPVSRATVVTDKESEEGRSSWYAFNVRKSRTTTDDNGFFTVENLKPGLATVRVTHPNYLEAVKGRVKLVQGEVTGGLDILLEKGGSITGRVFLDGGPLAGIKVEARDEQHKEKTAITGQDGAFRIDHLAPGEYTVSADHEDEWQSRRRIWKSIRLGKGETLYCELVLIQGGTIAGTTYLFGQPKEDIYVHASFRGPWGDKSEARYSGSARSLEDGTYRITGLPPGRYTLRADCYSKEQNFDARQEVEVKHGTVRLDLFFGATGSGEISGHAYRNGAGVPFASVYCSGDGVRQNERTDENGFYRFTGLPAGRIFLSAYLRSFGPGGSTSKSKTITLEEGASVQEDFHFSIGSGTLFGEVLCNGEPVEMAFLHVSRDTKTAEDRISMNVDARDGSFRVEGLSPGRYFINLNSPMYIREIVEVENNKETRVEFKYETGDAAIMGTVNRPEDTKTFGYTMVYLFKPGTCPWQEGKPFKVPGYSEGMIAFSGIEEGGAFSKEGLPAHTFDVVAARHKDGVVVRLDMKRVALQDGEVTEVALNVGE